MLDSFERQVAAALREAAEAWWASSKDVRIDEYLAPRVAVAIEAIAREYASEIENEHGQGRVPDGYVYQEVRAECRKQALAALRGMVNEEE